MVKVRDIVKRFMEFAPAFMAEDGDPIGLQLGSQESEVNKVMVTLDVRPEVVREAVQAGVDFIFAHHPAMFHPIKQFDLADPQNRMYAELLKHHITVFAAHTNLDNANGGMNDWLAEKMGLRQTAILMPERVEPMFKLAVFVPREAAEGMRSALAAAGAGKIGNYDDCSYSYEGYGRFRPNEQAEPAIGEREELTTVREEKVEVLFPAHQKEPILKAMYAAHPYEEPVFDLFQTAGMGQKYGMGRIGTLAETQTVRQYAEFCKEIFKVSALRMVAADPDKKIDRVAVLGGSGGQFYTAAKQRGAQLYVTGDISYHTGHDILAAGLAALDPGHHIESICKEKLATLFTTWNNENNWKLEIIASKLKTDPFIFV
ncbi:Nif3-like dinuclear metal center hexameric protein [Liquorilactobacillus capillatus]|uniref:GTP cyclohydrolase 1 type 2 homolog n=1 Tax=Liquorilactobacillus capillatus DSM 19910 TaxID=1423731 RepID=A0A0R1M048_9LACO|nr:Nif3-like dinuclear metal center hexameric protein [Liquorilactobacillus capillatus]KRL01246.1 hypothetical protein FC81_GL001387 [Liquorilactobacillus capillatus DSM 19910]